MGVIRTCFRGPSGRGRVPFFVGHLGAIIEAPKKPDDLRFEICGFRTFRVHTHRELKTDPAKIPEVQSVAWCNTRCSTQKSARINPAKSMRYSYRRNRHEDAVDDFVTVKASPFNELQHPWFLSLLILKGFFKGLQVEHLVPNQIFGDKEICGKLRFVTDCC